MEALMPCTEMEEAKIGAKTRKRQIRKDAIRVAIVEDHSIVREGLRLLIEGQEDMTIACESATMEQALLAIKSEQPDVTLLDLDLAGVIIFERIPEVLRAAPRMRVLVLTGLRDADLHRRAIRLGALGLVFKDKTGDTVLKAIRRIHAGEAWVDHGLMASLINDISGRDDKTAREAAKIATLSHREREIANVLCEGLSNKQIAERLFISEATVRNHLTSILSKLELSDRFELAIYSFRNGLAQPPH